MMNLANKISQIRGPSNDFNRLSSASPLKNREGNNRESKTTVVGTAHASVTAMGRQTVGHQMKRSLVAQSKTSVTSIASRLV